MSAGTLVNARSVSLTVTRKDAVTVLGTSSPSVAWHVTTVVPIGNVDPVAWSHVTAGGFAASSESTTLGDRYLTTAPDVLVALTVTSLGGNTNRSPSHPAVTPAPCRKTDCDPFGPLSATLTAPDL